MLIKLKKIQTNTFLIFNTYSIKFRLETGLKE